ncbi:hypothetical protein [Amycolatopsis cihanbeyliensis]|uniref:hypothetical protein n=1 Tax=Amycolatopsis cihanbeyliensis TaxID=1128664 RepID=UPI0011541E24|nr:hypothetical protein [Amycolatopsis cihanbeyliensis]
MNITVFLADYAQGSPGTKIDAMGLFWSRTKSPLRYHSVIIAVETDGDENLPQNIHLDIKLVDDSGEVVKDGSGQAVQATAELGGPGESNSPVPGIAPVVLGISQGLDLMPGVYRWQVTSPEISGNPWSRSFVVIESSEEVTES